ncbi:hypothetical protein HS1genome_1710 [Sulfodiicoccus acidiphilus]|uniref:Isoprenylcysteine carboxyl methyltransferase n=1 Tax=Sulfodiicoccus acidiphilus TaxID=1670455 RepID=A0A348B569_9CREN|nr:isoprenylcysteine carboxylmethyltransferase family protein [Sulfodiicoccus acidiphilus]BBD73321.1 hypothetical protein HS1genome_1710 [Sulfodiicoccus acidiphilus]GGT89123.1 hypothetical protein GCM10007116_03690 [Sulfodiicoccus acidiphilus]
MLALLYDAAWSVFAVELLTGYVIPALRRSRGRRNWGEFSLFSATLFGQFFLLFFVAYFSLYSGVGEFHFPPEAGVTFVAIGYGLRLWAVITLGRFFSPVLEVQEEHRLVNWGPYRYARHPSYGGALLAVVRLTMLSNSLLALIVPVLSYFIYDRRVAKEEKMLVARFPDYYRLMSGRKKMNPLPPVSLGSSVPRLAKVADVCKRYGWGKVAGRSIPIEVLVPTWRATSNT